MRALPCVLTSLIAAVAAIAGGACDPYSPNLGYQPFRCGTDEPRCPDGYQCMEYSETEHLCEAGEPPDETPDAGDEELCNNDEAIEPNDTTSNAWSTPIPDFRTCVSLVSLAICPAGDKDLYRFRVDSAGKNLKAEVTANIGAGPLTLRVLNGSGAAVANGQAIDGDTLQLIFNNMAAGTYFVEVAAPEGVTNNYTIDIFTCDETSCMSTTTCST
jgi:hypothetical protein